MKSYAIVGLGHRSAMYVSALLGEHKDVARLVGFCDVNHTRMAYYNNQIVQLGGGAVPTFDADQFGRMLLELKPDAVIVTSVDRLHHVHIIAAMEAGCDVICEKPLTIDAGKAQEIIDAQKRTGRKITVTFNYRYSPHSSRVKQLLMQGAIGKVNSVHFEWTLDTVHGADYFRRWHRDKANNGGLMVHKSSHHFDLINWWLDSAPQTVFGLGQLAFYGKANAESRGQTNTYRRVRGNPAAVGDPFALDMTKDARLKALYYDAEHEDGYFRDQGVFSEGITTEDDAAVLVKYQNGATMSYHLTAYSPWEGLRVMFNGSAGRLELEWVESAYNQPNRADTREVAEMAALGIQDYQAVEFDMTPSIVLRRQWCKPVRIPITFDRAGHGGGDARMLRDLFRPGGEPDPLGRAAGLRDGLNSILTGIAANLSFDSGLPVDASRLIQA